MRIGVLDIQGSVEEHLATLKKTGVNCVLVKNARDMETIDGLIIPGGESTTIGKLMKRFGLDAAIKRCGLPVWGTCAGAILLARLGLMNIEIERNAYGRQIDSFKTFVSIPTLGRQKFPAVFIRAPKAKKISQKVTIMARFNNSPVMLPQGRLLATMFHPELTNDIRVHKYFISIVKKYAGEKLEN